MILSNSNRKNFNADRLINDFIESKQSEKVLIIVPTNRKARQLKKMFISQSPGKIISQINIETLWTLADKIYRYEKNYIKLESPAANVFLNRCYKNLKPKTLIRYNDSLPYGTLEALKNFFSKLKERGIYPDVFEKKLAYAKKSIRQKAEDLLGIYKQYLEKTTSLNLLEIGDVFHGLQSFSAQKIIGSFRNYFSEVQTIFIIGFDYLNKPEFDFLSNLLKGNELEVIIKFDFYKYNPKIFGFLIETYLGLKKLGLHEVDELQPEISIYKKHLIENLFRKKNLTQKKTFPQIQKFCAYNRQQEVEIIAKEIKILLMEKKVKPNQIGVVFNQVKNYSGMARDIFDNYQIPANITDRFTLNQTASINAIINLLEILENNFSINSIQRAFATKVFYHEININNLLNFARYFKITSNYDRLINTVNSIKRKGDENIYDFDLEKIEQDLLWIKELLKNFENKLTTDEVLNQLDVILVSLNIIQNVLNMGDFFAEKNIRAIEIFFDNIKKMFNLLENESPGIKYSISSILEILRSIASNTRFNIKENSEESVLVTSVDEIRGLNFDYLFIGGLCYNDFPTKYKSELLNFEGDEILKVKQMQKERYRFFQAITSWEKSLYLLSPKFDGESELVKSNFLVDLEEIIDITEIDISKYEKRIFIEEDEQRIYGILQDKGELNLNEKIQNIFSKKVEIDKLKKRNYKSEYSGELFTNSFNEESSILVKTKDLLQMRKEKQYSASELEIYSRCPFQYFMRSILKVSVDKEPTEFIESIELGNYLHKIFFKFFLELRNKKISLKNCSDSVFEKAKNLIFQIAKQIIPKELLTSPYTFYDIEKVFGINNNQEDSILYRLIDYERNNNQFTPHYFEVSFGDIKYEKDELLSTPSAINANNVLLKGKIDRIDVDEDKFCVIDYKLSGRKPTTKDVEDGLALQLPIYAFAAEVLFNQNGFDYELDKMKIFSLKYSVDSFNLIDYNPSKKLTSKDLVELALEKIKKNVDEIVNGKFPLTEIESYSDRICRNCDYKSVCRINEVE